MLKTIVLLLVFQQILAANLKIKTQNVDPKVDTVSFKKVPEKVENVPEKVAILEPEKEKVTIEKDSTKTSVGSKDVKTHPVKIEDPKKEDPKKADKVQPVVKVETVVPKKETLPNPVKDDKKPTSAVKEEDTKDATKEKEDDEESTGVSSLFLRQQYRIEQVCQVGDEFGVCVTHNHECKRMGAGSIILGSAYANNGGCNAYACCSIRNTCGGYETKKITYFQSPNSQQARDPCVYTINAMNPNVCQVRLDFQQFSIAPASQQANAPLSPILCRDDSFDVITPNGFKPPTLCGYNAGQHMYIPLNASNNETMLQLKFRLAPRGGGSGNLLEPQWKIKVTQLECPYNNLYASPYTQQDSYAIAPTGCLQYHTDRTGTVCNFGYNPQLPQTSNSYITNMRYSICFKRRPDACGILFRSPLNKFHLSNQSTDCSQGDYVFIPEGEPVTAGTKTASNSKFCTNSINSATEVISMFSGPFSIQFSSDNQSDPLVENGFCLDYQAPPATCF